MKDTDIEELKRIFDAATDLNDFLYIEEINKERSACGKRPWTDSEIGKQVRAVIAGKRIVDKALIKVEKLREGNS